MAGKIKMDVLHRAKQFVPFAALKGFEEAIRTKEKEIIPKAELTQEYIEEINEKLCSIHTKDIVSVTFYRNNEYIKTTGMVSKIDAKNSFIQIVDTKIPFKDILRIDSSIMA